MVPTNPLWLSVIVYPRNNIRVLTQTQLFEIFMDKCISWPEIGGNLRKKILPLMDRKIYERLWPPEVHLGRRTILLDDTAIKQEVIKQPGALGLMFCGGPSIRGAKVIAIQGRKRLGRWKNWPISLSVASCEKFLKQLSLQPKE